MSSSFTPRPALSALGFAVLLLASACTTPPTAMPPTAMTAAAADPLASLTYDGSQQALTSLDRNIVAAGLDQTKLNAIAARLLSLLRDPAATADARQAACQRLALFPAATLTAGDNPALFAAMFADEKQVNFAKLALDHVAGAAVDAIFLRALAASTPRTRLAFVQSIGNRRIAAAVPKLAPLLGDTDVAVCAATAKALGQIGTPAALVALHAAPDPASPFVVEGRLAAAHQLGGPAALREFQAILDTPAAPANLRAAAFRGLLFAESDTATARFVATLSGHDAIFKPVVIEAIFSHPAKDLVSALTASLASWDAPTQTAVIAALGRKGDAAAVPAIAAATQSTDAGVRTAAIEALGLLPGTPDVAVVLARLGTGGTSDDAKLARLSLARLVGPGVAEAVIAGASAGEPAVRIVFLESLATRNMTDTVPLLLKTRDDPSTAIRTAALASLNELAPASTQRAILDWAVAATDPSEQSRALRTLATITLRDPNVAERARLITETVDQAPPALSLRLLPVLPRIGGIASAECTARLALRDDPAVSDAATNILVRWTDRAGLLPLVGVAEKAPRDSVRAAAARGAVPCLERSRDLPAADLRSLVTRLLAATRDDAVRGQLVYLLGRNADAQTLALVGKLRAEPALATAAADAALAIRSRQAGPPTLRASANPRELPNIIDGNMRTAWGVRALANQWIELDYHSPRPFRRIAVDNGGTVYNYPEHLEAFVTDDLKNPGAALASVPGRQGKTILNLPAGTRGRYLILRHTKERAGSWWTVAELQVD